MDKGGDARKKKKVKILFEFDSLQKMSMTLTYSLDSFFFCPLLLMTLTFVPNDKFRPMSFRSQLLKAA